MKQVVILMYHSLYSNALELGAIDAADRPYAISTREFETQLLLLQQHGVTVLDPAELENGCVERGGVILTFDDGHASNAKFALPLLMQYRMKATFFVTTGFVGQRAGYCTWSQVRELADNGMRIGGHGHTHQFLSDAPEQDLQAELQISNARLREALKMPVAQMSFPGGRFDARTISLARAAGFSVLHGSEVGTFAAQIAIPGGPLPRIAIRPSMRPHVFMDYAQGKAACIVRAQVASKLKGVAKRLIGNYTYHQLYAWLRG